MGGQQGPVSSLTLCLQTLTPHPGSTNQPLVTEGLLPSNKNLVLYLTWLSPENTKKCMNIIYAETDFTLVPIPLIQAHKQYLTLTLTKKSLY